MTDFSNQQYALDAQSWRNKSAGRMALRGGIAVLLLIAGGALALLGEHLIGAAAPANEVRVTPFQDWRMICQPAAQNITACTLNSNVQQDSGATLLSLVLNDPGLGKPLQIGVPIGVLLNPGMGFSAGNAALKVRPYETCTATNCIALVSLDADTLNAMRGSPTGHVVVALPGNSSPVSIPFSLKGFPDAYAALQREQNRQSSIFGFLAR